MKREKLIVWLDGIMEFSLCTMIFVLPFAKAGVEIFFSIAMTCWFVKRCIKYRPYTPDPIPQTPYPRPRTKRVKEKISRLIKAFRPVETKLNLPIGMFVIVGFLSMVSSVSLSLSLEGFFLKLFEWIMIYFIVVEVINNRKRLNRILIVLLSSMALISLDGIFQYITGKEFIFVHHYSMLGAKIMACFGNPNNFAGWLVIMIPLALSLAYFGMNNWLNLSDKYNWVKWSMRPILWIITGLLIVCLGLTYSRGAWIAIVLGLIFLGIFKSKKLFIIIIIVFLILPFIVRNPVKTRISSIVRVTETSVLRTKLWPEALGIIQDFPLLGCGLNTYATVAPNYKTSEKTGIYPHNSYLHMAAEAGLLGLGAFVWVTISLFKTSLANLKKINDKFYKALLIGLLAGLFAFLIHSFVDTNIYTLQLGNLMWFVMGLIISVQKVGVEG